jgi:anaerobic selenocysteine-containing dehydrogenase
MIDKIAAEQIKALIMLGEDLAGTHPEIEKKFKHMRFVAASNYFVNDLVDDSIVIFPLASQMEEGGTYVMADGRLENRLPIAPKVGGRSNGEIAAGLMGQEFNLNKTLEETGVIIRQGIPAAKTGIEEKIAEAQQIAAGEKFPPAEITHFGNNRMTRNFFWFRVNPHTLNMPCGQGVGVNNKVEG